MELTAIANSARAETRAYGVTPSGSAPW
jgi:hypothetical protein